MRSLRLRNLEAGGKKEMKNISGLHSLLLGNKSILSLGYALFGFWMG